MNKATSRLCSCRSGSAQMLRRLVPNAGGTVA